MRGRHHLLESRLVRAATLLGLTAVTRTLLRAAADLSRPPRPRGRRAPPLAPPAPGVRVAEEIDIVEECAPDPIPVLLPFLETTARSAMREAREARELEGVVAEPYEQEEEEEEPAAGDDGRPDRETRARGHEPERTDVRGVLLFFAALLVGGLVMLAGLWGLAVLFERDDPAPRVPVWSEAGPAPTEGSGREAPWLHWVDPPRDAALVLEEQRERLRSYGWVDREAGVVHVPIERAMEVMVGGQDARALMRDAGAEER